MCARRLRRRRRDKEVVAEAEAVSQNCRATGESKLLGFERDPAQINVVRRGANKQGSLCSPSARRKTLCPAHTHQCLPPAAAQRENATI